MSESRDEFRPRKIIQHPTVYHDGRDVYPPELWAAAMANAEKHGLGPDNLPLTPEGYRQRSSEQLLTLVEADFDKRALSLDDLDEIHAIALKRVEEGTDPDKGPACEVSRAVLRMALARAA